MDTTQFEHYQKARQLGKKAEASAALKLFLASFSSDEEKAEWSRWYLENEFNGHKVHHEIYEQAIFPTLLSGYQRSDPWSLRWLARTMPNLYQARQLWQRIEWKTDYDLLRELLTLQPSDDEIRVDVLSKLIHWFCYSIHEWPAGIILCGYDGTTFEQCQEILNDVAYAREVDREFKHYEFLNDYEEKVRAYQQRLVLRGGG